VGVLVASFGKEDCAGEEDDTDHEEEDEESQFTHARPDCLAEDLESLGVTGELEDPEDPDEAYDTKDG